MKKSNILEYSAQLIIVIVGVFLGMLVSNWNSQRNQDENRKTIINNIFQEIESNKVAVRKSMDYHRQLTFYIDSVYENANEKDLEETYTSRKFSKMFPIWRGTGSSFLNSSMFETAKFSNTLPGMDVALLVRISKTYQLQETYKMISDKLYNKVSDFNSKTKFKDILRILSIVKEDLYGVEYLLLKEYDSTIELIRKSNN